MDGLPFVQLAQEIVQLCAEKPRTLHELITALYPDLWGGPRGQAHLVISTLRALIVCLEAQGRLCRGADPRLLHVPGPLVLPSLSSTSTTHSTTERGSACPPLAA